MAIGNAIGVGFNTGGGGVTSSPEIDNYVDGLQTPLSENEVTYLETFIINAKIALEVSLLSDGAYFLYILSGETSEAALRNLVKREHDAEVVDNPAFTQGEGFTGVVANSAYIKTNFIPLTHAPNSQDYATFGVFVYTAGSIATMMCGVYDTDSGVLTEIYPKNTSSNGIRGRINQGPGSINMATHKDYGLKSVYRLGAAVCGVYSDTIDGEDTDESIGLPAYQLYLFARNNADSAEYYGDYKLGLAFYSKYMTINQHNNLEGAFNQYLFDKGKHLDDIMLFRSSVITQDDSKYQGFGNMAIDSNGKFYVMYRTEDDNIHGYSPTGSCLMRTSVDGITWGGEITISDVALSDERAAALLVFDDNGVETLMVCWRDYRSDFSKDWYIQKAPISTLVFEPKILAYEDFYGPRCNPILLSNGKIIAPGYQTIKESSDGGETWTSYDIGDAVDYIGATEPSIVECKTAGTYQGKVVVVFRNTQGENLTSISTDFGHTWTDLTAIGFEYNTTSHIIRHYSDTLLLFIGGYDLTLLPLIGVFVYKSIDEGDTWTLCTTFGNGIITANHHPSVVYLGDDHFAYNWCDNKPGSDVHVFDIIIDPNAL